MDLGKLKSQLVQLILIVKYFTLKILVREGAVRNLIGLHALYLFKIK